MIKTQTPDGDLAAACCTAGLNYVVRRTGGMKREKRGKQWVYIDEAGKRVRSASTLKRIASLVIPPAWTDVWISADPRAHVQATGKDARGRTQYRYHAQWREAMETLKYDRMIAFASALPTIRTTVKRDLKRKGLPREKVLAAVVRLLEETLIRIGNEEYVRENRSFGLSTLRDEHVTVRGKHLHFHFRGKSGKVHDIDIDDHNVAPIVRSCKNLPGREVFEYVDADGKIHDITAQDVNEYLHRISKGDFTAKDFRTWAGTVHTALALEDCPPCSNRTQAKRNVVVAVKKVASTLGNTPAVCRKSYIHPLVLTRYVEDRKKPLLRRSASKKSHPHHPGLSVAEGAVLELLEGE